MSTFLIALFVLALLVSAAYAVLARGISPLGPVRRAGVRGASRRRDPQRTPRPQAPRRDALPVTASEFAWVLRKHQWEPSAETPELAKLSAHIEHGYYPRCAICIGDVTSVSEVLVTYLRAESLIVSPHADLAPCGEHAHPGPSTDGDHSAGPGCVPNVP
ncbi:hypothetical protein [Nocardia brasiliensis]|uniref:hypothetical protein n=1 Tax=Nocardia brasiliensis TaxID=37326 RepID=UPI002455FA26|nr:hypothetical protein [Nocardia brasiliensis]